MDFEVYFRVVLSFFKIIWLKIVNGSRLKLNIVQSFGKNSVIKVSKEAKLYIGKETISRNNLVLRAVKGELKVGDKCFFNSNVSITAMENIEIGDGCQIANNVVIVDHDHDYKNGLQNFVTSPVTIGRNVWIGANCVILKGSKVGDNCVIASGTTVRGEMPDNTLVYEKKEIMCKKVIK